MASIKVTPEYGLIIRRASLEARAVSYDQLLIALHVKHPLDQDQYLISFGPSFGQEALSEFIKRLEGLGLVYWDDFFEFKGDYPSWCEFEANFPQLK
ncbi:MAG: hypothetical protein ACLPIX_20815 [Rhodomicrobium sp.]